MNKEQKQEIGSIDMELTVEGLGQTLKVIGNSLYIGNEYSDNKVREVFVEDISRVENKELIEKLRELNRLVQRLNRLLLKDYKNDWKVDAPLDRVDDFIG